MGRCKVTGKSIKGGRMRGNVRGEEEKGGNDKREDNNEGM